MLTAIISKLTQILTNDIDIVNWENLNSTWQRKIQQAGVTNSPDLIYPHSIEALATIINYADQHNLKLLLCGNGSKLAYGGLITKVDFVVSTQKLSRLIEHAVSDLTITVEAGMKLADLQAILQQHHQFLPLDPAYPETATIGGIIATADTGSWRQGYGSVRDLVLGVAFVRADGKTAKAGGRVVKNVAGYDLMKLFTGSYGTLGAITQVTFRVYPLPAASKTIILTGETEKIATITQTLRNSALTPTAADLLSSSLVKKLEIATGMGLILRFQTIPESIQEQTNILTIIAEQLGLKSTTYQNHEEINLWQQLTNSMVNSATNSAITCKIGILPTSAVNFLTRLETLTDHQGLGLIHISSGLGKLNIPLEKPLGQLKNLRNFCQENHGFLTILEAPIKLKQEIEPWGYSDNALTIMDNLKQKFDPKNTLNPSNSHNQT